MDDRLYFRQWLAGRDFARDDPLARQMVNFVYAIGDRESGTCVLVDPAYDVDDLLDLVAADDMSVEGVLATHYHPDHVGGEMMGISIVGVRDLLERRSGIPVHVQQDEVEFVKKVTGLGDAELAAHGSGDVVSIGAVDVTLVHTPGHTPGSQCFLVAERLVSGDTLFLDGCGRTDLPGGDPREMYRSLTDRLAKVPDRTLVFPGHLYSTSGVATMGATREHNYVFKPKTEEQWLAVFS